MLSYIKEKLGFSEKQNLTTKPKRLIHSNYRRDQLEQGHEINRIDSKYEARLEAKGLREQAAKALKGNDSKTAKKFLGDALLMESIANLQDPKYKEKIAKKRWLPHAKTAMASLQRNETRNAREILNNAVRNGHLTAEDLEISQTKLAALMNVNVSLLPQLQQIEKDTTSYPAAHEDKKASAFDAENDSCSDCSG